MPIELPVLRLGVAGFSAAQQEQARQLLKAPSLAPLSWQLHPFAEADAWWLEPSRTKRMPGGLLQVDSATPREPPIQLTLADIDRPVAWGASGPMTATAKGLRFDLDQPHTAHAVLAQFGKQLHAVAVQFGLASSLAEHYQALGGDAYDVIVDNRLAAVVDMRGDVALSPRADCTRFGDATWQRRGPGGLPGGYHHTTVSELMWLYATRTTRDLLPPHYRTRTLFYRRPPRVPQRLLGDSHLKVLRELSLAPTTFDELSVRTKIPASALARALAALHFVGGVTSNPRRACPPPMRPAEDSCDAVPVSMNHSMPFTRPPLDATAPATLSR